MATWRTLRKQEKTQNNVIAIFCKDIIRQRYETIPFNTEELQKELQNAYGFCLPNSVIEEILSKELSNILSKNANKYTLVGEIKNDKNLNVSIMEYEKQYRDFSDNLLNFIKSKLKGGNSQDALNLFNEYLLNEKADKIKDREIFVLFADFLLHNQQKYENLLQTIKEGVILYEGLTYNIYKTKATNKLTLFLDTEIIFSAMGYNGKLDKKKFDEFYNLICKYDENRLLITLYYDEFIELEIKNFFYSAKEIKKRKNANYKPTAAMLHLMENFQDEGEIESELSRLFYDLERNFKILKYGNNRQGREEKNYEELLNEYTDFNLESLQTLENIKQEVREKSKISEYRDDEYINNEIQESIRALNFINLMRHSYPKRFFESKVFLITNTALTNTIAWHKDIMEGKNIPLSTKLDFITARLWELLESSLGNKLETLNPIFKIQILLKEIMRDELDRQYIKTNKDYELDNDENRFRREIIDIQEKFKLEPNIDNIEDWRVILSFEKIDEERKIIEIEKDKQHKLGLEKGEEIGIKKGIELGIQQERKRIEKEAKRREKKDKIDKLKKNICNKLWRNAKKIWRKIKKYYKTIITSTFILFLLALIGSFGGFPSIVDWIKGFFYAN